MEAIKEHSELSYYNICLDQTELIKMNSVTASHCKHFIEKYVIGITISGARRIEYRNIVSEGVGGGSIYVLEPGETLISQAKNLTCQHLYVEPVLLQRIAEGIDEQGKPLPHFRLPRILDASLYATLHALYARFADPISHLQRREMLFHALGNLLLSYSENRSTPRRLGWERPAIKRVKAYMDEHYAEEISLEDLACIANLSAFHLARIFRQAIGLPPHAYQAQVRLDHARRLLSQGLSVSYVASETGFFDQAHFTHQFKRYFGVTPGTYMKTARFYSLADTESAPLANTDELRSVFSSSPE
ncbi:AraC family transcriptional regulator [Reticulibacter mediterranei]|uniref:AraC family transcriptional regulator n=1 Tax=Reticulibacter mediterranei TaxID=2778369 RepID=A0A8J3IME4_9CHLR|nr:AraC family transcriptional regulator [Reticulibacter mediterranei]GHO95090.1 AraC family transcriptional regulator [Reticulibacter mediterranei]